MQQLSISKILEIWELSSGKSALYFAIDMICEAFPNIDHQAALVLPVGLRDTLLLEIRKSIFGPYFENISLCPDCQEKVEWQFDMNDLQIPASVELNPDSCYELKHKGYIAKYRLLNTSDILAASSGSNLDRQAELILSNCVQELTYNNNSVQFKDFPEEIKTAIYKQLEKNDTMANIEITLSCPNCQTAWNTTFDIITYLWSEIDTLAQRLLHDIGLIASNFGWSEEQILKLSSSRRTIYREMLT